MENERYAQRQKPTKNEKENDAKKETNNVQ